MAAIIIIDAENPSDIIRFYTEELGFQHEMSGYWLSVGAPGETHRPIKDRLPNNVLYHPAESAEGLAAGVYAWAQANGISVQRVFSFAVGNYYVASGELGFDNDKPLVKWEDITKREFNL